MDFKKLLNKIVGNLKLIQSRKYEFLLFLVLVSIVSISVAYIINNSKSKDSKVEFNFTSNNSSPLLLSDIITNPVNISESENKWVPLDESTNIKIGGENDELYSLRFNDTNVSVTQAGFNDKAVRREKNIFEYAIANSKYSFEVKDKYVKETIILNDTNSSHIITSNLRVDDPDIELAKDSMGGLAARKKGKLVFYIQPPKAFDAGDKSYDYELTYKKEGSNYTLILSPENPDSLAEAIFPISIDPTISWAFSTSTEYMLSDPSKVEIVDGVAQLKQNGGTYALDNPYIINSIPVAYNSLTGFSESLASGNQGSVRYQLSKNGEGWYWHNGSSWTAAANTDYNQANTASQINSNIASFTSQIGSGGLYIKAFLHTSNASLQTRIDSFVVDYSPALTAPTLNSLSVQSGPFYGGTNVSLTGTNFYNSWPYRKKITINELQIPGTGELSNFPVLINETDFDFRAVSSGGRVGKVNGGDIKFTLADGVTKLNHEIEKYNPVTGELIAWVNVPLLSKTSNTSLYIYYGNAGASDQWNITGTWSNNQYRSVWHMKDTSPNDSFTGTSIDTNRWTSFGTVSQNDRIILTTASPQWSSSGLHSGNKVYLSGDFDVQFDFDASSWGSPTPDSHEVDLYMSTGSYVYYLSYFKTGATKSYLTWQSETSLNWGGLAAPSAVGKLRMTRVNSTLTAYYWNGSSWISIGTFSGAHTSENMFVNLAINNRTSSSAVTTTYIDNFIINKGDLVSDSTNKNNGGNTSAPLVSGKVGNGRSFNGTTSYVVAPYSASLNVAATDFSIESWVNSTQASVLGQWPSIISNEGGNPRWGYDLDLMGELGNTQNSFFGVFSNGTNTNVDSGVNVRDGNWHHVVATKTSSQLKIYIDGVLKSTASYSGGSITSNLPTYIGRYSGVSTNFVSGIIDEVRVYYGAQSDDWITASYNNQNAPSNFYSISPTLSTVDVIFGGVSANNISVSSVTNITVTTPVHSAGVYDVVVANPDGQTSSLTSSFTFTTGEPAPSITQINPNLGPVAGGTNITITGANFILQNTGGDSGWAAVAGKTLPAGISNSQLAVIGDYVYLFGGTVTTPSNAIYRASVADPTTWTNTGKTLPAALANSQIAVVGNSVYLFGGYNGSAATNVIYSASITDPTTWTNTGKTIPGNLYNSKLLKIGEYIYLFGGYNGTAYSNVIYKASLNSPTYWSNTGKTLPTANIGAQQMAVIGNTVYMFGGYTGSANLNTIYSAPVTDPTSWVNTGKTLPAQLRSSHLLIIGSYIYLLGGSTGNPIYRAAVLDPTTWITTANTLPSILSSSQIALIDNYVYFFGGYINDYSNVIYRAPVGHFRTNLYNNSWITNWPTIPVDQTNLTIGGVAAANIQVVDASTITATTGANVAGNSDVIFTNYDGQSFTLSNGFEYIPPPAISNITPPSSSKIGGNVINISGSDFAATPIVSFGNTPAAAVLFIDAGNLQVTVPAHVVGTVDLTVTNPDGQVATMVNGFTFQELPPDISSIAPASGPTAGGTSVVITGNNYFPNLYKKPITVTNSNPTLSNYQVLLTIDTGSLIAAGKMKSDGSDIRFYEADMSGTIPYWIESGIDTNAKIWIKIPSIPNGQKVIYMTYGNSTLTAQSNPHSVFELYEDFTTSLDSSKWNIFDYGATSITSTGGQLKISGTTNDTSKWSYMGIGGKQSFLPPIQIDSQFSIVTQSLNAQKNWFATFGFYNTIGSIYSLNNADKRYQYYSSPSWFDIGNSGLDAQTFSMQNLTQKYYTNGNVEFFEGGTLRGTKTGVTGSQGIYFRYGPDLINETFDVRYDNIKIRKFSSIEPSYSVGTESKTLAVYFDGLSAIVDSSTSTSINVTTPAHNAGSASINIVNGDGQSTIFENSFTYINPPSITSISPSIGEKTGGASVTITGSYFIENPSVTFGNTPSTSVQFIDANTLSVVIPAGSVGLVNVTVTNPDGQSNTLPNGFSYTEAAPTLSSINPNSGPTSGGTLVTITGSNFYNMGKYRLPINLTNSSGIELIDYQIEVTLNTAAIISQGKMRSDGGDIRFADSDGSLPLSYWVESGINTNATKIWVKVPKLPSGNKTIYLIYGNSSSVSQSSTAATFVREIGNIQGHWQMEESSGNAIDSSGRNNTAIASGTSITSSGKFGKARSLNGVSDYLYVSNNATLQLTNFTVGAWYKQTSAIGSSWIYATIISKHNNNSIGYNDNFNIYVLKSNLFLNDRIGFGGTTEKYNSCSTNVNDGNWHYLTLTSSYTSGQTTQTLYNDGISCGAVVTTGAPYSSAVGPLNIGQWNSYGYFPGLIDSVTILSSPLTSDGVNDMYNNYPYTTTNYPGKILLKKYSAIEPSVSLGSEEAYGPNVFFGSAQGTNVVVTDSNTLTVTTTASTSGVVDVIVINPDGQTAQLENAFKYGPYTYSLINQPLDLRETEPGLLTVQAQDHLGNAIVVEEDTLITLTSSSNTGFFARNINEDPLTRWNYINVIIPGGQSSVNFYYKDNQKGTPEITVSTEEEFAIPGVQVENITSRYRFLVTGVTNPIKSGVPSSVTVVAIDYEGNPLPDYEGTVFFSSTDSSADLPSNFTYNSDMLGEHTFVNGITMVTQGTWCVGVTDVNDSDITGQQCGIDVTPPNAGVIAELAMINGNQTIPVDMTTSEITIQTQDVNNQPIPVSSDTEVYIYSSSASGQFSDNGTSWSSSPFTLNINQYTTSTNVFYRDTTLGTHQLIVRDDFVSDPAGAGDNSGWINAQGSVTIVSGNAYRLVMNSTNATTKAGDPGIPINITMQDIQGNILTALQRQNIYITIAPNSGFISLDGENNWSNSISTSLNVTESIKTIYFRSVRSGTYSLFASDSTPANGNMGLIDASIQISVTNAESAQIVFSTAPGEVIAGDISDKFTIEIQDEYGNPVAAGSNTNYYLYSMEEGGHFAEFPSFGSEITQITITQGQSTADFYFKQNKNIEVQTIIVSDNSNLPDYDNAIDDAEIQLNIVQGTVSKFEIISPAVVNMIAGSESDAITTVTRNQFDVQIPLLQDTLVYFYTNSSSALHEFSLGNSTSWQSIQSALIPAGSDSFTFYYKDIKAGTHSVQISDDEQSDFEFGITNDSIDVVVAASAPEKLSITSSPFTITAGQPSNAVVISLLDSFNNLSLSNTPTTINLASDAPSGKFDLLSTGQFDGTISQVTIPAGEQSSQIFYRDIIAGNISINVSALGLTSDMQMNSVIWGNITELRLSTIESVISANEVSSPIEIRGFNQYNINIPSPSDIGINLISSNTSGLFDELFEGSFGGTTTSLIYLSGSLSQQFFYKDTSAGTANIIINSSGNLNASLSMTILPATPAAIAFSSSLPTLEKGQKSDNISVQIEDSFGNITNSLSNTTIYLYTSSVTGQFFNSNGQVVNSFIINSGQSSGVFAYRDTTSGSHTITLTDYPDQDTGEYGLSNTSEPIEIVNGEVKKFILQSGSSNYQAGQTASVTLIGLNRYDQEVPAHTDISVILGSTSTSGTFANSVSGPFNISTITLNNNTSRTDFYYIDNSAGSFIITASQGGYTTGAIAFNITGASVSKIIFSNIPKTVIAGESSTAYNIQFQDQFGNFTSTHSSITINLSSSDSDNGQFSTNDQYGWGINSLDISAGVSSVIFYYSDTMSGTKTITLSSSGLIGASQSVLINAAAIDYIRFVISDPETITVQAVSNIITIRAFDQFGNIAQASSPINIRLSSSSSGYQFSANSSPFNSITSINIAAGTSQVNFYYKDFVVGNSTINIRDSLNRYDPITKQYNVVPGNASKLIINSNAQTIVTNTPSQQIQFYVGDNNNYKTTLTSDRIVTANSSSSTGLFSQDGTNWSATLNILIAAGEDTSKIFYYSDSEQGNHTVSISSSGLTASQQIITVITGTIERIVINSNINAAAGTAIPITLQTQTSSGLPVAVTSNVVISLISSSPTGQFSLSDQTWSSINSISFNQWQYERMIYFRDTAVGNVSIRGDESPSRGWVSINTTISISTADYAKILISSKPANVVAEAVSTPFVVQTTDVYGNIYTNGLRTIYLYGPSTGNFSMSATGPWTQNLQIDIADAQQSASFYYQDSSPGSKNIIVSDKNPLDTPDSDKINASATLQVLGQTPTTLNITTSAYIDQQAITAGAYTGVITIEALKSDGSRAIIGNSLSINLATLPSSIGQFKINTNPSTSAINTISIGSGQSEASVYFTSTVAGLHSFSFTSVGLTGAIQDVQINPASPNKFVFMTSPQSKAAGQESDIMQVQLQDQYGNRTKALSDMNLLLQSTSVTGKFSKQNGSNWTDIASITMSNLEDQINFFYKDTVSGSSNITIIENPDNNIVDAIQIYNISSADVYRIAVTTLAQTLEANQPSNAYGISLFDQFGNIAQASSALDLFLYSTSENTIFASTNDFAAPTTKITINPGVSNGSFFLKDNTEGTYTIKVSETSPLLDTDTGIIDAQQEVEIIRGEITQIRLINPASSLIAGNQKLLQIRLYNKYNAIVQSSSPLTVYLHTTSTAGEFSLGISPADAISAFTIPANYAGYDIYYKDTKAGNATITISDHSTPPEIPDTAISNAVQTFLVQPADLQRLVYITPAQNIIAGQTTSQIIVQARDLFGNIKLAVNDVPVYLYTTSPTGQFSLSTNFAANNLITSSRISAGFSTTIFYYKDGTYVNPSANPKVTVSNQFPYPSSDDQIIDAVQIHSVSAGNINKLVYDNNVQDLGTIIAGSVFQNLTLVSQNQYSIEVPVNSNKTLYPFSTSPTGEFALYSSGSCTSWGITSFTLSQNNSRVSLCYRDATDGVFSIIVSDTAQATPDTAWTNATANITVDPGIITQLSFTNTGTITTIARHPSVELKVEARNQYGNPTNVTSAKTVYLRSSSLTGEFATSANGPWGISFVTIPAGMDNTTFYYHDTTVSGAGTYTLSAADSLPLTPDIGWTNGTINVSIVNQTMDNFLVTNISDPQVQGSPSSVVVLARDSDNYIVDWYTGTIVFASSDPNAIIPQSYTFTTEDKGIKTFTNGVAFAVGGEHTVTVTDGEGIDGSQNSITVQGNTAGPINKVQFLDIVEPFTVAINQPSAAITIQSQDFNNQPSNAPLGGFPVKLTSSSLTGEFASDPSGPWSNSGLFSIPQNFNSLNIYYRDTNAGTPEITLTDWFSGTDDIGIENDQLQLIVNSLQINTNTIVEVNNIKGLYLQNSLIFSKNDTGYYNSRVNVQISTIDGLTGQPISSDIKLTWKHPSGVVLSTDTITNVNSHLYSKTPVEGSAAAGKYTLEIEATNTQNQVKTLKIIEVDVSGWTAQVDYNPDNQVVGLPLPFTLRTRLNGVLADPVGFTVNFRDNNGSDLSGNQYFRYKIDLEKTSTGVYSGSFDSTGLIPNNAYSLYARIFDQSNNTLAEDNHHDIFFENNVVLAPKNFIIEKVLTSIAPETETYNLKFNWDNSQGATKYTLYRSQNKFATLFADTCTVEQIKTMHRYGDLGALEPLCEQTIQQNVGTDDLSQWVELAEINAPATQYIVDWNTVQDDLPNTTYFYVLRAENSFAQSGYSSLNFSVKRSYSLNVTRANTNWISIPYSSEYQKASDIVIDIEGGQGVDTNVKISALSRWRPGTQNVESFSYNAAQRRWRGVDFDILPGDGVSLRLSNSSTSFEWTVAGKDLLNQESFVYNDDRANTNWVSLPYTGKYSNASDIINDIEGSTGEGTNIKVSAISRWRPGTQNVETYSYNQVQRRWRGVDFGILPGDGVSLRLSGSTSSFDWVTHLVINPYQ